ncbi:hypothetical protein [Massilia aerilata]|uniref:Uncharacterized protein n=1 Tax=Massilia aerilata TaxID=453817 RepID=A0ABW0S051_9BURK
MLNRKFTNADINQLDWARRDRATMLRSLHAASAPRAPRQASSGWATDVTGNDPRSVRAYLAGKGDLRATWWNLFSAVYMAVVPAATLTHAMYAFHRFHHALTIGRLTFAAAVSATAADLERDGIVTAVRNSVAATER